MFTEFASVQFSREELKEIHEALLLRAMVQDELRRERGLEKVEPPALLERFEALLGENEERLHVLDHATEDGLWEYAWYVYTDEWAWYRAAQEVAAEAGAADPDARKRIELAYQKNFDRYVSEIDMRDVLKKKKEEKRQPKTG